MDGSIRVLHVDDEPEFAELTATFLERQADRFTVETVQSPAAGRDRLAEEEFDCVVSDYDMPAENGIEFLKSVRESDPDLPFILFTGKGSEQEASNAISAGVTDYLQKQTGTEQFELLAKRISTAVGQYRAENELERQSDLFAKTQALASVGAWEWYPATERWHYSEQVYEIFGIEARDGKEAPEPEQFYHPEDRERVGALFADAVKDGDPFDVEARIVGGGGDQMWVRTRGDPQFEDGRCVRVRGTVRDITDRKRRETALEDLNDATHEFIDASDKTAVAESAVETARSALGMDVSGLWLYDDEADVLEPVAITERAADYIGEIPTYTGDGSLSWRAFQAGEMDVVEDLETEPDSYNPETALKGEIIIPLGDHGVMNIGTTGTVEFTETDISLAQILGNTVEAALSNADRIQQLHQRRREVDERNERLAEFVGVVSHDLRTPLTAADGHLELASRDGAGEHVTAARDAIARGEELIEDLLALARDADVGETEPVALPVVCDRCWDQIERGDATLDVETALSVEADRQKLQQLLENLFRNAIDHGGADVDIAVGALDDGVYVEDDGPGIPADQRAAVFEAGYSTHEEGTGFGLRIVEQVVDAHGWEIAVVEGSEGGARFEITGVTIAE